jgi:hypothetical protein
LNLAVPGSYSYKLSGLPHAELIVGVAVVEDTPNGIGDAHPAHPAHIRVELRNCENQVVILEEGALDSWVQSYALRDANLSTIAGALERTFRYPTEERGVNAWGRRRRAVGALTSRRREAANIASSWM